VRLLLDAHVSGRVVGAELRKDGHDVLAADEREQLSGATDATLLHLAASEQRILVTFDTEFSEMLRNWADAGRHHSGCIMLQAVQHNQFGAVLRLVRTALEERPDAGQWEDLALVLTPSSLS
jgi:predicted nuclease of predicted toxin-antitoxin system